MFSSNDRMCLAGADTTTYDGGSWGPAARRQLLRRDDRGSARRLWRHHAVGFGRRRGFGCAPLVRTCSPVPARRAASRDKGPNCSTLTESASSDPWQALFRRRFRRTGRRSARSTRSFGHPTACPVRRARSPANLGPRAGGRSNADSCRSSGRSRPSGTVSHPPPGPRPGRSAIRCDSATRQLRDRHSGAGAWRN